MVEKIRREQRVATMPKLARLDKVAIGVRSRTILRQLLNENPKLHDILTEADKPGTLLEQIRNWMMEHIRQRPDALAYYRRTATGRDAYKKLNWQDFATIRILDYVDHAGREFEDPNLWGGATVSNPFRVLWLAFHTGCGGGKEAFFEDMLQLFRQFKGELHPHQPDREQMRQWMARHPSGLDPDIIAMRNRNRDRILNIIVDRMDRGELRSERYRLDPGLSHQQKLDIARKWWDDRIFHLRFAVRDPDTLNAMLDFSMSPETMKVLYDARDAGIPFFVNPYYLSLLNVHEPDFAVGADLAIRDYIIYSRELVEEFGEIVAWEKEDIVEPGKPNAAGWILPSSHSVHRRYPEVAILIPETVGRACGGLCTSCQRMYDFQRGHLNFDLDKLRPNETWPERLLRYMHYFEQDAQLRDILITGGDAFMNTDASLKRILQAVYQMAVRKREANRKRPDGEKYAEIQRVRLGTRLPVYLPQRITPELVQVLADFKTRAREVGIRQFVVQTHVETAMEVTPEAAKAIHMLTEAGWTVTNQMVFTAAASRRGHAAKLRKVLNDLGVLSYYTFTVKGFNENHHSFATNARAVQEQMEEKCFGLVPETFHDQIRTFAETPEEMVNSINGLRREADIPFLATDRNVLNLPGVGKSLTFRTIGITRYGRRILEFDHDHTRNHSPIIHKMGRVVIIESKPILKYLKQLTEMGEDPAEYATLWGYSMAETEPLEPVYDYPAYDFTVTRKFTNLQLED